MIINSDCTEAPIVNGIIYPDGKIQKFRVVKTDSGRKIVYGEQSEISEDTVLANIYITDRCFFEEKELMLCCGETSWGGDGFILCEQRDEKRFVWLLSSSEANPFISISLENGFLLAQNNCHEIWKIDMSESDIKAQIAVQAHFP